MSLGPQASLGAMSSAASVGRGRGDAREACRRQLNSSCGANAVETLEGLGAVETVVQVKVDDQEVTMPV